MAATQKSFSVGSVKRLIVAQAVPMTVAQVVHLLYNIVDRMYIGHLKDVGDLALTGLGITFPVIVIIAAFTSLFGSGGSTLFSLARGRGDKEEAEYLLGNVFTLLVSFSVILFAFCYIFRRKILFLFGAGEQSFYFADQYLKFYLLGTPFAMITTGLNNFIGAQGFPKIGMLTTVIGALLNVALDPIFIFVFDMGVQGAAIATVISQVVSAAWVIMFFLGKKAIIPLKKDRLGANPGRVKKIVSLGLSGFVMQGTNSLVSIVCNNQLLAWGGEMYVGIMTVINSVREMLFVPCMGLSQGASPILGFNYGAKRYDRVKEGIRFFTITATVYLLISWGVVMLIPKTLISLFTDTPDVVANGSRMLKMYFFGFCFMALMSAAQTTFQSLGMAKRAIFFSLLRKVIIVVPLTLLLPAVGFGVSGVFLAEPVSNVIGGIAAFTAMYLIVYRKL